MSQTTDAIKRLDDGGEHHDVVVVGGGQAGLASGHYLTQQGCGLLEGKTTTTHWGFRGNLARWDRRRRRPRRLAGQRSPSRACV